MSFLILLQLILPSANMFEIVSDRTERGGASELVLTDVPSGLNFKGQVGSIQGSSGPVGFALARFPNSTSYELKAGKNDIQFLWTQMEAKIRGRLVPSAPKFQPEWAETFAIQVARSQQPGESFDPIQFDFTVLK